MEPQHDFNRTFECIQYPGKVRNMDRAIETLGGRNHLSEIMYSITEKLELRFRPEDPYCKPTGGEKLACTGLLVRVKIVRKKKKSGKQTVDIVPQVLGKVTSWFQFKNMCDFQYLPIRTNKDGSVENILPSIQFSKVDTVEDLHKPVELFLPPVFFSKLDSPQLNLKLLHSGKVEEAESDFRENMICMNRRPRDNNARIINFDREEVPPAYDVSEIMARYIRAHLITMEDYQTVVKAFEERPIISKTTLRVLVDVEQRKLKLVLPLVAYYFYTGPFRVMWVRLGYDPRQDKNAAKYQVLDFRLRNALGVKEKYGVRRSTLLRLSLKSHHCMENTEAQLADNFGFFRPGFIPPFRQMFYQLCDIQLPEVEQLLAAAPLRDVCHEKMGWFKEDVMGPIREHISDYIVNKLEELENIIQKGSEGQIGDSSMNDDITLDEDVIDEALSPQEDEDFDDEY